jgi:hypothetical protein
MVASFVAPFKSAGVHEMKTSATMLVPSGGSNFVCLAGGDDLKLIPSIGLGCQEILHPAVAKGIVAGLLAVGTEGDGHEHKCFEFPDAGGTAEPTARASCQASVGNLDEQVAYHRAFEAVLSAMPAVAIYRLRCGLLEQPGLADNDTNQELITANVFPRGGRPCEL